MIPVRQLPRSSRAHAHPHGPPQYRIVSDPVSCAPDTKRLWCVLELLTFLAMGASTQRIVIMPIAASGPLKPTASMSGIAGMTELLSKFDANEAQCFDPNDRDRLLAVAETAYGSLTTFNEAVRSLFLHEGRYRSSSAGFPASPAASRSKSQALITALSRRVSSGREEMSGVVLADSEPV